MVSDQSGVTAGKKYAKIENLFVMKSRERERERERKKNEPAVDRNRKRANRNSIKLGGFEILRFQLQ